MNNFKENEIVVLKPQYDDSNYKRLYTIQKAESDKVYVSIYSEIDAKTKEPVENFDQSVLGPYESNLFQSYM